MFPSEFRRVADRWPGQGKIACQEEEEEEEAGREWQLRIGLSESGTAVRLPEKLDRKGSREERVGVEESGVERSGAEGPPARSVRARTHSNCSFDMQMAPLGVGTERASE